MNTTFKKKQLKATFDPLCALDCAYEYAKGIGTAQDLYQAKYYFGRFLELNRQFSISLDAENQAKKKELLTQLSKVNSNAIVQTRNLRFGYDFALTLELSAQRILAVLGASHWVNVGNTIGEFFVAYYLMHILGEASLALLNSYNSLKDKEDISIEVVSQQLKHAFTKDGRDKRLLISTEWLAICTLGLAFPPLAGALYSIGFFHHCARISTQAKKEIKKLSAAQKDLKKQSRILTTELTKARIKHELEKLSWNNPKNSQNPSPAKMEEMEKNLSMIEQRIKSQRNSIADKIAKLEKQKKIIKHNAKTSLAVGLTIATTFLLMAAFPHVIPIVGVCALLIAGATCYKLGRSIKAQIAFRRERAAQEMQIAELMKKQNSASGTQKSPIDNPQGQQASFFYKTKGPSAAALKAAYPPSSKNIDIKQPSNPHILPSFTPCPSSA